MIEAFRKLFFAEFLDEGRIGEIGLSKKRFGGAKVFLLFPVNGNLRFGEFVLTPGCLRFCFLANFGHGSNSLWRIDFDCDATTRNSLVRASSFQEKKELARTDDATAQPRESIYEGRYFIPPTSSQILWPCVSFSSRPPTTKVIEATIIG